MIWGKQFDRVEGLLQEALEELETYKKSETEEKQKAQKKTDKKTEEKERLEKLVKERNLRVKPLLLVVEDERMTQGFYQRVAGKLL